MSIDLFYGKLCLPALVDKTKLSMKHISEILRTFFCKTLIEHIRMYLCVASKELAKSFVLLAGKLERALDGVFLLKNHVGCATAPGNVSTEMQKNE